MFRNSPRFKENAPRSGFVEDAEYAKLIGAAENSWFKAIPAMAYSFGFRRSELLKMKVAQIDVFNRKVTLEAGSTKNDEARTLKMTNEVYELLLQCVDGKKANDYVFTRGQNEPVLDFSGRLVRLVREGWTR
jgi:integrase